MTRGPQAREGSQGMGHDSRSSLQRAEDGFDTLPSGRVASHRARPAAIHVAGFEKVRRPLLLLASLALALGAGEAALRWSGVIDFPLYEADATIGYIPKASQRGSFLNRNDWVVNERHMGAERFAPGPEGNVLLVGDSVVWGGNPYARDERLGPQLQQMTRKRVWPIAAGSWGLQNELTYLAANADVVAAVDTVVLVLNSGDFAEPSSWTCELSHPRERPLSAAWYVARKYVIKEECGSASPADLTVQPRDPLQMLSAFVAAHPAKRLIVFLYPEKSEVLNEAAMAGRLERFGPALVAAGVKEVVSVGRDPRWRQRETMYRDAVHPTAEGNRVLARLIADRL